MMSFHPQTPQSPSQFSPATSSDPSLGSSGSVAAAGTGTTTLPTPAHSVNGSSSQLDSMMLDDSPQKRKRPLEDVGDDRELKKPHVDDYKLAIEDLHRDVGHKYLLLQSPHPESFPRTSEDLYEMYDLVDLATEVAREKPNGEKNALRKTYKGHIKRLGVTGHFDVAKKNDDAPSDFLSMLQVPDHEWNVHQVKGRSLMDGLSDVTKSTLGRALTMAKGPVPKSFWDSSVLGDIGPSNGDSSKAPSAKPTAPNTPLISMSGASAMSRSKSQLLPGQNPARPQRSIKKRSYGDSSYEGYGEGFPDDDTGLETGYSTGEGEGGQKRRKKSSGNTPPYPSAMRQSSYGPGMVGV
ncbi:uncharacterized protein TrAFT101_008806 [Trichoderma asperellum]|uniref:uncharacterized protein n=1 Tax=Trichoderma asperellum TaxID=101201 RepID=UPI00332F9D28|nr:hypothetical protein TrAFT101_008806 [Trichoderma asperellum]